MKILKSPYNLEEEFKIWSRSDKVERFGQWVINRYSHQFKLPQPSIFYEENPLSAFNKIFEELDLPSPHEEARKEERNSQ